MSALFPAASRLGFGCASLGSRVDARRGREALAAAFDHGVNWFDVAPSYGDGNAEALLGAFARGRRDRIHICTKCGIEPPRVGALAAAVRPLARLLVQGLPGARRMVGRVRPTAERRPLSGASIRASLEASLRRLAVDHVDVLALHDPTEAEAADEEIAAALSAILAEGKARAIGVAGSSGIAKAAVAAGILPLGHVQFADRPGEPTADLIARLAGSEGARLVVTHSVAASAQRLVATLDEGRRRALEAALAGLGYDRPLDRGLHAAALDLGLANNPDGVVLVSMFSPGHLRANLARLAPGPDKGALAQAFAAAAGVSQSGPSQAPRP